MNAIVIEKYNCCEFIFATKCKRGLLNHVFMFLCMCASCACVFVGNVRLLDDENVKERLETEINSLNKFG